MTGFISIRGARENNLNDTTLQIPESELTIFTGVSGSSSEEVPLNWNRWVRQTHRWLCVAFTVAVIVNIVAVAQKRYTVWVGLLALLPLAVLLLTGLYMFVLPYPTKWRSARRTG